MTIRRPRLAFESHFTQLPNLWLRDARLSRRARGLLAELMTHQAGWEITTESLVEGGPEGRDALLKTLTELETAGYLLRETKRSAGRFSGTDYVITDPHSPRPENPVTVEPPCPENPDTVFPDTANPEQRTLFTPEEHQEEDSVTPDGVTGGEDAAEGTPEDWVARRAYEASEGALNYMGMKTIAKWAIKAGYAPEHVLGAMGSLWKMTRAVTKQTVGQRLQGLIADDGRSAAPRVAAPTRRMNDSLSLMSPEGQARYLGGAPAPALGEITR